MRILVTGASGFIGTNLIEHLIAAEVPVVNLDLLPPLCSSQRPYWQQTDILDRQSLVNAFEQFQPTHVIHLAARTDCDETETVDGYVSNTDGTANVLHAVTSTPSIERLIVTSTQFVCGPDHRPKHDEDYAPHTVYGQSKVITEQLTRQSDLDCVWTIVRPTTVWGPWLVRHRDQFFRVLRRGLYVHPGRQPCTRSWGYVGNVVHQICGILAAPAEKVDRRTYYVGDPPINLLDWVNACSLKMRGRKVHVVPRSIVYTLGLAGDAVGLVGIKAPITRSRYRSMTQDYVTPMEETLRLVGELPYSMEEGVEAAIGWAETHPDDPAPFDAQGRRVVAEPTLVDNQESRRKVATASDGTGAWPRKVELFGVDYSPTSYDEATEAIVGAAAHKRSGVVSCHAVHALVTAACDPELRDMINAFDMVTPDGQPVRWAMNLLHGVKLGDRVYGPELTVQLCERAAAAGVSIYLYGGSTEVVEALQTNLHQRYPDLVIAGYESPPYRPLTPEEDQEVVERINASGAGIVFIGLGCPKQDIFAFQHRERIRGVQVCVGAAFDFHAGTLPMAPHWMQRSGLEWLFRLSQEPKRLWRRYLVTNSIYLGKLSMALLNRPRVRQQRRQTTQLMASHTI